MFPDHLCLLGELGEASQKKWKPDILWGVAIPRGRSVHAGGTRAARLRAPAETATYIGTECTIPALCFSQRLPQTGSELSEREIRGFSRAAVSCPWGAEGTRRACRATDPQ